MEQLKKFLVGEDVLAVARSLRSEPEAWATDAHVFSGKPYSLVHQRSGLRVWVANSVYGMDISKPGLFGGTLWGGVTFLSTLNLSIGHWVLWAASRPIVRARSGPKPTAARILAGEASS